MSALFLLLFILGSLIGSQAALLGRSGIDYDDVTQRRSHLLGRQTTASVTPVLRISDSQPQAPGPSTVDVFTIGTVTITANPTGFTVGSHTIAPGGPPQTIDSTQVSLDSSSHIIIGTSTATLTNIDEITIGGSTITADPSGFSIGERALDPL